MNKDILKNNGFKLTVTQLKEYETYVEDTVNMHNDNLKILVEIHRGRKLRGTVLELQIRDIHEYSMGSIIIDLDEVEIEALEPVWEFISNMELELENFIEVERMLNEILDHQGTGDTSGCIMHTCGDLD